MKIEFSPHRRDDILEYKYEPNKIIVTYHVVQDGEVVDILVDTFDFTDMLDGVAREIITILPLNPIEKAEKINGELFIRLLHFHGPNASHEDLYPVGMEV